MADDFFKEDKEEPMEEQVEEEKIKVGEKEYSQEELSKLVGLGELGVELEEKWNTKLDKLAPEYTKSREKIKLLEDTLDKVQPVVQPQPQPELTDEETLARQVKETLGKYGYIPGEEVEERARKIAAEVVAGYKLLDTVNSLVTRHTEDGNPQITSEDLLSYMQEKNIQDPEVAYKVKFEKELDAIKEKKLASLKPSGLVTESSSTAGGKQPTPVKITRDNFKDILGEYLGS